MENVVVGPCDLSAHVDEALAVQALAFGLGPDEVIIRRQIVLRHLAAPGARSVWSGSGGPFSSTVLPSGSVKYIDGPWPRAP